MYYLQQHKEQETVITGKEAGVFLKEEQDQSQHMSGALCPINKIYLSMSDWQTQVKQD